jgi:hypothetical protein
MFSFLRYHRTPFLIKLRKALLSFIKKIFPNKYYFVVFVFRSFSQSLILFIYYFSFKKNLSKTFFYVGSDKYYNYKEVYDILECLLDKKKVKNILEIGIGGHNIPFGGGQSLCALNLFYSRSKIFAVDIVDKSFLDNGRIKTFVGDQSDTDFLNKFADKYGPFDLIIDDGSHFVTHQKKTFNTLFDHLNDGGVYICEDCGSSYLSSFEGDPELSEDNNMITYFSKLTHAVNLEYLTKEKLFFFDNFKTMSKIFFFNKAVLIQKKLKKYIIALDNKIANESLEEYNQRVFIKKNKSGFQEIV